MQTNVAQLVKSPLAMWETWVRSLGWEETLEKRKATHSIILAWKIPWTVYSMGLRRVRHDWMTFTSCRLKFPLPFPQLLAVSLFSSLFLHMCCNKVAAELVLWFQILKMVKYGQECLESPEPINMLLLEDVEGFCSVGLKVENKISVKVCKSDIVFSLQSYYTEAIHFKKTFQADSLLLKNTAEWLFPYYIFNNMKDGHLNFGQNAQRFVSLEEADN